MNTPVYYGSVGIYGAPHLPRRRWFASRVAMRLAVWLVAPFKRTRKSGRERGAGAPERPAGLLFTGRQPGLKCDTVPKEAQSIA